MDNEVVAISTCLDVGLEFEFLAVPNEDKLLLQANSGLALVTHKQQDLVNTW